MRVRKGVLLLSGLALATAAVWTVHTRGTSRMEPAVTGGGPVVVELFTSEGCSSCPPADEVLREFAAAGTVNGVPIVALSEHVDYWDRLGWKDRFSSAAFTDRQQRYSRLLAAEVYTPQMVVDGGQEFVGSDRSRAVAAIVKAAAAPRARVTADATAAADGVHVQVDVARGLASAPLDADVLVALTEGGLTSNVTAGENRGRRLVHAAVVRRLDVIGHVKDANPSSRLNATIRSEATWTIERSSVVVLLQKKDGAIVGAWSGAIRPNGDSNRKGL
jgi:hypothetical protein